MSAAVLTPESAANSLPHPPRAGVGLNRLIPNHRILAIRQELAEARPVAFVSRHITESVSSHARRSLLTSVSASVERLRTIVEQHEWSQREFARHTGLSFRSWRRIQSGAADPVIWRPKIEAALTKLNPS